MSNNQIKTAFYNQLTQGKKYLKEFYDFLAKEIIAIKHLANNGSYLA